MLDPFYYLVPGDPLEIGDEYEVESAWRVLTESDYSEWVTAVSHYWPEKYPKMSRFRRPLNKDPQLAIRTKEIFRNAANG